MKIKSENDRIFKNNNFNMVSETVFSVSEIPEIKREKYFSVAENTVKETTIQAILMYSAEMLRKKAFAVRQCFTIL